MSVADKHEQPFKDLLEVLAFSIFQSVEHGPAYLKAESVFQLARDHKVLPFVISELQKHADIAEQVRQVKYHIASHALRYFHELQNVLEQFKTAGIDVVPFKGMALSFQLYGDYHKRQFVDLDLFVNSTDAEEAIQILQRLGYQLPALSTMSIQDCVARFSSIEAFKKNRLVIDLQWDLSNQYAPLWDTLEKLMAYTERVEIDGVEVRVFNPELTFYLLGVHGAKNGYCELRYILDFAAFLSRNPDFDYAAFLSKAKSLGIERFYTVGALLSRELFHLELPETMNRMVERSSIRIMKKIKSSLSKRSDIPVGLRGFILGCRFKSSLTELSRYIFFRIRPTKGDVQHGGSVLNAYWFRMKKVFSLHS